ncbi:MAG: xanthine dehydrogenase family protein subunit M [Pseudomonadota bacterium]|jgi:Aerobic-type carbon monoxide dehydrogenase, middle subunit CoxM/CutM homologs|nr:MAG: xanthine dehydrogenase family protein subunit M [Pseudomonadota bacterium]
MSRDMMPHFELYQPDSLENALDLAKRLGRDGWIIAGGYDSLDWFKDRVKRPKALIDLGGIESLKGIRETPEGLEIGALTTLTEIERSPIVREKYGLLADAARRVASPQIRNAATLGGNLCQDARCWYYRYGVNCYRAGGNTCYADTPQGQNREHCLFGASRCVAVSPSDMGTAAVALDARMVVRNSSGERVIPAEEFFIGPAVDITRMTVLEPGDILTAVRFPAEWAGAKFYFEKVSDREAWDFALVSIASAMILENGVIRNVRMACGAVECVPRRLKVVEQTVTGSEPNEELAQLAGKTAVQGATPLNFNHFKIPLMENLVRRAIRAAA